MKILHLADLHLGSKLDKAIVADLNRYLKLELRNTFNLAVTYANENYIKVILLAGDVFDSDYPNERDKTFFYDVIKANPDIDFLYLRGNHDKDKDETLYADIPNLKTFGENWTYYNYANICIAGLELATSNRTSFYQTLVLDPNKVNIVMLHGIIGDDASNYAINIKKLANKHINYLALGHIHKSLIANGPDFIYAYPGCLMGRSFDETGSKGMLELNIDKAVIPQFIPLAKHELVDLTFDISPYKSDYEIALGIKNNIQFVNKNLYRLTLTGSQNYPNLSLSSIYVYLGEVAFFLTLSNKSSIKLDFSRYLEDKTIKGEIVRLVNSDNSLTDSEKDQILSYAFKALRGESLE